MVKYDTAGFTTRNNACNKRDFSDSLYVAPAAAAVVVPAAIADVGGSGVVFAVVLAANAYAVGSGVVAADVNYEHKQTFSSCLSALAMIFEKNTVSNFFGVVACQLLENCGG